MKLLVRNISGKQAYHKDQRGDCKKKKTLMEQNTRSSKLWEHEVLTLFALHWHPLFQDVSWLIDVLTLCLITIEIYRFDEKCSFCDSIWA